MGKRRVKLTWMHTKIQELRQLPDYFSAHLIKKIFKASTQDYMGMRHDLEVMPKKSIVVRFPSLLGQMCGIHHNK